MRIQIFILSTKNIAFNFSFTSNAVFILRGNYKNNAYTTYISKNIKK